MNTRRFFALVAAVMLVSCSVASNEAREVADRFWDASQAGDTETVRSLVASGSEAKVNEPEDGESPFGGYTLGQASIEDGVASVETTLEGMEGSTSSEVQFTTFLVQEDGAWKVDLDRTTNDMMRVMLGVTMEQLGEMMGEAMQGMVEGMAEGMKEGMAAMGEAMREAADSSGKENPKR